jgi:NAD(P)-dependent dehydrogenase (short-subunit alcohol dehydrogenase family)
MAGHLTGKAAVVTGAGRGIGRGEALLLAAEGARVVVNDVDGPEAMAVVDEITAAGGTAIANTDDVSDWAGAEALVGTAVDRFGQLDVLVNNAGFLRDGMSFNLAEQDWEAVTSVHLDGHFAPSHFAAAHWRARSKSGETVAGRIVNTTSEAGLFGQAGQSNYAAAKAGIAGLTITLARELHRYGVTVNAIAPRARTRMTEAVLGDMTVAPDGGFDEWHPDNIAPVVAWLASDGAAAVSGQVFVAFGGRLHLMTGWSLASTVEHPERWTVDALVTRSAELFGERRTGVPPMGFGQ